VARFWGRLDLLTIIVHRKFAELLALVEMLANFALDSLVKIIQALKIA